MAKTTRIEWCDSTVNPTPGCTGCELYHTVPTRNHCYAATLCNRYAGCKGWPKSFTEPEFFPGRIEKAIAWADLTGKERPGKPWLNDYPRVIFLNDLGDTFAPTIPDPQGWLVPLMGEMAKSPHLWLFLTKWPQRMCEFFTEHKPPENFWLGTTILNQKWADKSAHWLLQTPAAVRFMSVEPMLEAVDLSQDYVDYLEGWDVEAVHVCGGDEEACYRRCPEAQQYQTEHLDLVICGGESGTGARPMHPDWARSLRDQCQQAGVPFFFKQWGAWLPESDSEGLWPERPSGDLIPNARQIHLWPDGTCSIRHGKKASGRLLDGRTWDEMPGQEVES